MLPCPRCRAQSVMVRSDLIGGYAYCYLCAWQTNPKPPVRMRQAHPPCDRCRPVPHTIELHNAVRDIRRRRAEGEPVTHIAAQLGVSERTIHRHLRYVAKCGGDVPLCDSCAGYPAAVLR